MKSLSLIVLSLILGLGGGSDITGVCTFCACQYLTSTQLTDTLCTADSPVLQVNCSSNPKVNQNPSQFLNAPTTSNQSTVLWVSYKHARLTRIPTLEQFTSFNVSTLSLDHNKLIRIPSKSVNDLSSLVIFTASHNDISFVAEDAFRGLRNLRYIDLSSNSLHTLDFKVLLDAVSLVSLNVQNNTIKKLLPPGVKIRTLEILDLSVNKIPDFPLEFFSSFPALRHLNISYLDLGRLTADLFHGLANLKVLDASGNQLKAIDRRVVESLTSLNRLYLTENYLTQVDFLDGLSSLNSLDLSFNNFSSLGTRQLNSNVERLVVSHNHMEDLSHIFKVFDKLKSLDAGWNPCAVFPEHVRAGLRELILDGTLLSSWPAQTSGDGSIDFLSLSHIPGIVVLGPAAFSGILRPKNGSGKCAFLRISNTSLSSIDEDAFRNVDICKLDLSDNQLRWVPESLVSWKTLVGVDLQHNPWHCDCALQWMLSSVVPTAYRTDQTALEDLRCASPAELAGVRLVHWLNHGEAALCGPNKQDAMLVSKSRSLQEPADRLIQLSSSPLMLGVLLLLAVLAAMMVILALALQRRNVRMRKLRRNRRF